MKRFEEKPAAWEWRLKDQKYSLHRESGAHRQKTCEEMTWFGDAVTVTVMVTVTDTVTVTVAVNSFWRSSARVSQKGIVLGKLFRGPAAVCLY